MELKTRIVHDTERKLYYVSLTVPTLRSGYPGNCMEKISASFTYGEDGYYPTATDAIDVAIEWQQGAVAAASLLINSGGIDTVAGESLRMKRDAKKADESAAD
jgi:hypothetical protein